MTRRRDLFAHPRDQKSGFLLSLCTPGGRGGLGAGWAGARHPRGRAARPRGSLAPAPPPSKREDARRAATSPTLVASGELKGKSSYKNECNALSMKNPVFTARDG